MALVVRASEPLSVGPFCFAFEKPVSQLKRPISTENDWVSLLVLSDEAVSKKKGEVRWGRSLPNQQGGGSVVGEVNW